MPDVSVIVPARDAETTIGRTLAGLARQHTVDFEVIVVDDGSADGTSALARNSSVGARVLRGAGEGPAEARNQGAREAHGGVLAFVDADCEPQPGWLAAGLAATGEAQLVQGLVRPPPDTDVGPWDRTLWVLEDHGLYETANLFVTREVFERVGGFESWLRPRRGIELGEDAWFGWCARRAGAATAFCEDAVVHHAVFPRSARDFVAERARLSHFPALAGRIPELREALLWRRVFLNRRSAAFDLALAGTLAAAARRRPAGLAAAVPYAWIVARDAVRWGSRAAPRVAAAGVAADAVGAAALASGSLAARQPVL